MLYLRWSQGCVVPQRVHFAHLASRASTYLGDPGARGEAPLLPGGLETGNMLSSTAVSLRSKGVRY